MYKYRYHASLRIPNDQMYPVHCTGYMYRYEITAANRVALTNFKACDNSGTVDPSRASESACSVH